MATITISGSANYDVCSGQTTGATLDVFSVLNGKLIIDSDTKFCAGHTTTATASNGSLDSVTVSATAINGGLLIDGRTISMIPYSGGSGTAPTQTATALVPTNATWSAGVVTLTVTNTYANGDWIGVGGIFGADILDGYNGLFEVITATGTTLTYAVTNDPGVSTVTNGKCLKYFRCDQTQTFTATTGTSWAANEITYTTTVVHNVVVGNTVVVTGASPAGYNGTYVCTSVPSTTTFTVAQVTNPGAWTSGGTITKTVKSVYLGAWSSWTAGPVTGAIAATGFIKVKNVLNGPFLGTVALTIQGGTAPVATAINHEERGWIEVVGAELTTTPAAFTIPRLARMDMLGDWFKPYSLPFALATGTAWAGSISTYTTVAVHGLTPGAVISIKGTNPAGYDGDYIVLSVPTTSTFTVWQASNPGAWTSGGFGYGRLSTNNTAQQTIQLPASGGTTVGTTPYAGVWVEKASTFGVISTASWATNVVTFTTTTLGPFIDSLAVGDKFHVLNVVPAGYNGSFTVVSKTYASTTTVTVTAALTTNPGTYTSGGALTSDLTITAASWTGGYTTYTTSRAHGLYAGQVIENILSSPVAYDGIFEIYDAPSLTTFRVVQAVNPGTFVSTDTCQYEFWVNAGNMTATASMFATNSEQGKQVWMGAAGLLRFGGDGTNAWGYLPPPGMKIIFPNIICVDATKVVTNGVSTQVVPSATLTSRPKLVTGGVIGVVNIDKVMMPWYLQAPQAYSFTMNHVGQCESINFSEIASSFRLNNVGTGISVIASSAQASALNLALNYGGGTLSNCTWGKFHNGTSGYYNQIWADTVNVTVYNDKCKLLTTTTTGGGTARNATSGSRSLTRVANCTFTDTLTTGGTNLQTTCTNNIWTNSDYIDTLNTATTATTGQTMFGLTTNTSNITINGITFGKGIAINVHPYAGLMSALVGSNNIKLRNVGTVTKPLSGGTANAMGVILTGAAGGAAYNIQMQRIYATLLRTGHVTGADNSYSGLTFEDCWAGQALAYTNVTLNAITKKLAGTNATTGQTAVYGHHWEDFYTPTPTTLAAGTAWATTNGGQLNLTTAAAHNLLAGDVFTVAGAVASAYNMTGGYNGTFTVATAPTGTTLTVLATANPGTWTSGGQLNPLLGKIVLQMNEKTSVEPSASSYTVNKIDAGSGFTSVGTLALLNVSDEVEWLTPHWLYGHKQFTNGAVAPFTVAQPTFTATNPNNHNFFYDLNKGAGFSGVWKNLHFKSASAGASWAITGTTTVTLTPVTASVTGSIAVNVLTVTALASGVLNEGQIVTGTGIAAGTIITRVIDAPLGKLGTYEVSTITYSAGSYTIAATNQTVASTTVTGSTSTYGIKVGDNVFDLTTAGNVATNTKVSSISSATVFVLDTAGTNSTSQVMAFSSIHSEASIVAATGFKMKIKVQVNTYATSNLLTTVAVPTVTSAAYQATQYPLDTITLTLNGLQTGSDIVILNAGTTTELLNIDANAGTTYAYVYSVQQAVDIGVFKAGYVPFYIRNYSLSATNSSLPIAQVVDRAYGI